MSRLEQDGSGDPADVPPGGDEPFTEEADDDSADGSDVDEMSEQSFPTSDPPSTWAGPDEP